MRVLGRTALLVILAASVGCAGLGAGVSTQSEDGEKARLRRDLLEARQRAVMAEVEAERLVSEVAELKRQLEDLRSRATRAPEARPAEPVVDDITEIDLGGDIEEVELEEPPPLVAPPAAPPSGTTPPAAAVPGESAQAIYDQAYAFFHEKRYAEAERGFRRFLEHFPDSHLADNAQFWIGECRWARGDFSSALAEFSETVDRYPHGNKVADALLKAGRCLEALNQRQQAIVTYREVVARFPGSAAALSAQQLLEQLGGP